jgi:hypothetical protein
LTFWAPKGDSSTGFIVCNNPRHAIPAWHSASSKDPMLITPFFSIAVSYVSIYYSCHSSIGILSTDGICCNNVFITFDGISLIATNGFILERNNISDLYLLPIPATKV